MGPDTHLPAGDTAGRFRRWFLLSLGILGGYALLGPLGPAFAEPALDRARAEVRSVHVQALLDEGKRECERGHQFRAIRLFSAALNMGAGADALTLRGQAYQQIGESDKALADLTHAIALDASDPAPYLTRGDVFSARFDYEKALLDFDRAIELSPSSVEALLGRGLANIGLERYARAVKDFEAALAIDHRNAEALWNLGTAQMLAGRPNAAREAFQTELQLELDPAWKRKIQDRIVSLPPGPDLGLELTESKVYANSDTGSSSSRGATTDAANSRTAESAPPSGETTNQQPIDASARREPTSKPPAGKKTIYVAGNWDTTYLGFHIKLDLHQTGNVLSGVLKIQGLGGDGETYHFTGTISDDGRVSLVHHEGHRFNGTVLEKGHLTGVLTINDGRTMPINFWAN